MLSRRDWLRSSAGVSAFLKTRLSFSFPKPEEAAGAAYVPEWQGLLKKHRIQPLVAQGATVYGFGADKLRTVEADKHRLPRSVPSRQAFRRPV